MIDAVNARETARLSGDDRAGEISRRAEGAARGFQNVLEETITRENLKGGRGAKRPVYRKLMDACVEMESLFVAKMLKEMRKTVHKGEMLHGGFAEEIFEDMLYDEYAKKMAESANFGLAAMIYRQVQPSA